MYGLKHSNTYTVIYSNKNTFSMYGMCFTPYIYVREVFITLPSLPGWIIVVTILTNPESAMVYATLLQFRERNATNEFSPLLHSFCMKAYSYLPQSGAIILHTTLWRHPKSL